MPSSAEHLQNVQSLLASIGDEITAAIAALPPEVSGIDPSIVVSIEWVDENNQPQRSIIATVKASEAVALANA